MLDPEGLRLPVALKHWSLITEETVNRLRGRDRANERQNPDSPARILVGDRITEPAKRAIRESGWGYIDLRGELSLREERLIIQATFEPRWTRPSRTRALSGKVGLEVATRILIDPQRSHPIRELARELDRSPSTVSNVLSTLRRDSYITSDNRLVDTRLFWAVADQWPDDRTYLHEQPTPASVAVTRALGLELDDHNLPGWALTESAAAAAYGAPVAVRSGQTLDFYVPSTVIRRRAQTLLHPSITPVDAGCSIRVAPVPTACAPRFNIHVDYGEWPATHPVFVALDLAQDQGRGREILEAWTPDREWSRVW